jgi:hypothetical protein
MRWWFANFLEAHPGEPEAALSPHEVQALEWLRLGRRLKAARDGVIHELQLQTASGGADAAHAAAAAAGARQHWAVADALLQTKPRQG